MTNSYQGIYLATRRTIDPLAMVKGLPINTLTNISAPPLRHKIKRLPERKIPEVFNKVYHEPREMLSLSIEEYCILDTIDVLSQKQFRRYPTGWCYAGKEYIARVMDMNRASIHRIIARLIKRGLLEKGPSVNNNVVPLRTAGLWKSDQIFSERNKSNGYNYIQHSPRRALNLSCAEYCILDTMARLEDTITFIWNKGSRFWLAYQLKMPISTFCRLFKGLYQRHFIEDGEYFNELAGHVGYQIKKEFLLIVSQENRGYEHIELAEAVKKVKDITWPRGC